MSKIKYKPQFDENKSFEKPPNLSKNSATTKYLAVLPSRHTLAIFMPYAPSSVLGQTTGITITTLSLLYTCFIQVLTVYGGLRDVIKYLYWEYVRRLDTVVETRHPLSWVVLLTKYLGVFTMNTNTPQATHTFSTPLFTFTGTIKPVQAHQPSRKPNKQFDNLLVYVPSLKTAVRFDSHLNAFGYASHLKSIYPLIKVGIYGNDRLIDTLDAK